jgi:hypothetical protein
MQNIHSSAMLVDLRISQWTARKIDKKATGEVAAAHGVASSVGTYYKSVLPSTNTNGGKTAIEEIKTLVGEARAYHYKMTLPWFDSGPRVLSNLGYIEYMQKMQDYVAAFNDLVDAFAYDYPFQREEAKRRLGTLFNDMDYPEANRVAEKFSFTLNVLPIPQGSDFRCDIGDDEVARIRSDIEKNTMVTMQNSLMDAFTRVRDVTEAFVDRLQFDDTVFRDTLVGNAKELAAILPKLNFTGDPKLSMMCDELEARLCAYSPQELRNNMQARRETYEAALDLKKDLAAFFGSYQNGAST